MPWPRRAWQRFRGWPGWAQTICVAVLVLVVVAAAAGGAREGDTAELADPAESTPGAEGTERDTTTTTQAPATTTTVDPETIRAERQAGADAACAAAVGAPLWPYVGSTSFAATQWNGDWAAVGTRAEFDAQVEACTGPQRSARVDAECVATPDVGLLQRDPDSHTGQCVTLYAQVVQFDQATGLCAFRAWWDDTQHQYNFDYEGENAIVSMSEPCPSLTEVGVDDTVDLRAVVIGGIEYETTIGGVAHGVQFQALTAAKVADGG